MFLSYLYLFYPLIFYVDDHQQEKREETIIKPQNLPGFLCLMLAMLRFHKTIETGEIRKQTSDSTAVVDDPEQDKT